MKKTQTTFAAPSTWTAMDPAALGTAAASSPALKEMADRTGYSAEQLSEFLAHVDLFLAGPAVDGYASNIQAVVLPVLELPNDAALSMEISRAASSKPTLRHTTTPVGDAVDVSYRIRVAAKTIHVHSLLLDTGHGVLDLTVGATSEKQATAISTTLLKTAHPA